MIIVSENHTLFLELRGLLIRESSGELGLSSRIDELRDIITSNVRSRLVLLDSNISSVSDPVRVVEEKKAAYSVVYGDLKYFYRQALSLADDCKKLKKLMRERKTRGFAR